MSRFATASLFRASSTLTPSATRTCLPLPTRCFSTLSALRSPKEGDSTSAFDYKLAHRLRKLPPLPSLEPPEMDASEAVSNILYNTPVPSKQPFKR